MGLEHENDIMYWGRCCGLLGSIGKLYPAIWGTKFEELDKWDGLLIYGQWPLF